MNTYTTVEYVWLGASIQNFPYIESQFKYTMPFSIRSKTRVLHDISKENIKLSDIPNWNYDGSSTGQANTINSEIFLSPKALFNDPFRDNGVMVLCDIYIDFNCTIPHLFNARYNANKIFLKKMDEEPWFGIEQEFFVMLKHNIENKCYGGLPPEFDYYFKQGQYYCGVGSNNIMVRDLIELIADKALKANIKLSGWNAEVAPSQWEFQVGILNGIDAADHLWMLRYIMERCTENTPYYIELHPKPLINYKKSSINGSGCHTNYSTKSMRTKIVDIDDPLQSNIDERRSSLLTPANLLAGCNTTIKSVIEKLQENHIKHIDNYGEFNDLRLIGSCETSSIDKFTYGIADRSASIRIPTEVAYNGVGYIEDRRPSSLMDPYIVTSMIFETTCL
jgi:glutamine synthetase